jgi:hypothetical protein
MTQIKTVTVSTKHDSGTMLAMLKQKHRKISITVAGVPPLTNELGPRDLFLSRFDRQANFTSDDTERVKKKVEIFQKDLQYMNFLRLFQKALDMSTFFSY